MESPPGSGLRVSGIQPEELHFQMQFFEPNGKQDDGHDYLVDVLQRMSQDPASQVEQLTPRVWNTLFATDALRSDSYEIDSQRSGQ